MTTESSKREKILVAVAWPYANGPQHIGHIAGAYLPPDIFARFNRMLGNEVLMVSGSDTHGTPVTLQAEKEGVSVEEIVKKYHSSFLESYQKIGLTFDIFTSTHTENHQKVVHEFFLDLLEKGFIYKDTSEQLYDIDGKMFLPDRYVEGRCPHCNAEEARGDQCDNCGKTYDAIELKDPVSKITGSKNLEIRETEHFYIDLGKLNDPLLEWISKDKDHWRKHVLNFTRGELGQKKLRGRPITRDLKWGVTIPLEGFDDKRIYVWFDAVQGYLSATKEFSEITGKPEYWKDFWSTSTTPAPKSYYFIGKDNITFHSIMWPAMLVAKGDLVLPHDVPANEYLNSYGRKFSKSRGTSITVLDVLERYQPDAWRYSLTAMAPETADVDFSWDDFLEKVNNELIANWGNLVNRVLGFAYKRFDGKVPSPGTLDEIDEELLKEVSSGFGSVAKLYGSVELRSALEECRRLSQKVNQYLNEKEPWSVFKKDPEAAATSVYVALQCIDWLKTYWAPILPFSSQIIHTSLGFEGDLFGRQFTEVVKDSMGEHEVLRYDHSGAVGTWKQSKLNPGQVMVKPEAPFQKLDDELVKAEAGEAESG